MFRLSVNPSVQRAAFRVATRSASTTLPPCRTSAPRPGVASNSLRVIPRERYISTTLSAKDQTASLETSTPTNTDTDKAVRSTDINTNVKSRRVLPEVMNLWLRDACPCAKCVDPHSGQKTFATVDLGPPIHWKSSSRGDDGSLTVVWAKDVPSGRRDHVSVYPAAMLPALAKPIVPQRIMRRSFWDRKRFTSGLDQCRISYKDWMAGGKEFWDVMARLATKGLVFVYDVPKTETSVVTIGEKIGPLQETFYGRTWDVVSKPKAENVAYTSQHLGLHQDLLYHPDTPRIQLLHCLDNDCEGGESLFSDGVHAATITMSMHDHPTSAHYASARYGYNKNGNVYERDHPLFQLVGTSHDGFHGRGGAARYLVENVWWSPPFQVPFPLDTANASHQTLTTFRKFGSAFRRQLEREAHVFEYKMQPGECVVFDNWRVLHGRRQFNTQSGKRWLKGTYIANSVYTARFEDMPADVSEKHALWTDTAKEAVANSEYVKESAEKAKVYVIKIASEHQERRKASRKNAAGVAKVETAVEKTTRGVQDKANPDPLQELLEINNKLVSALLASKSKQTQAKPTPEQIVRKATTENKAQTGAAKSGSTRTWYNKRLNLNDSA